MRGPIAGFVAALIALGSLSACAGLFPKKFDPQTGQSLLVLANRTDAGTNTAWFRRIDRASQRFVGTPVTTMYYSNSFWRLTDTTARPDIAFTVMSDDKTGTARTAPPGEYALVGMESFSGIPNFAVGTMIVYGNETRSFRCFQGAAPTFSLGAGEVVIVPVGLSLSNSDVASEFAKARAKYPEIQGAARVAELGSIITFGPTEMDLPTCMGTGMFSVAE